MGELKKAQEGFRKGGDGPELPSVLSEGFKSFIDLLVKEIVQEDLQNLNKGQEKCPEANAIN